MSSKDVFEICVVLVIVAVTGAVAILGTLFAIGLINHRTREKPVEKKPEVTPFPFPVDYAALTDAAIQADIDRVRRQNQIAMDLMYGRITGEQAVVHYRENGDEEIAQAFEEIAREREQIRQVELQRQAEWRRKWLEADSTQVRRTVAAPKPETIEVEFNELQNHAQEKRTLHGPRSSG